MASLHRYTLLWLSVAAVCTFATQDGSEIELDLVFTEEPQDVIVLRGEPFVFNCSAISVTDNRPVNITWRRDGVLVHDARHYVLPNGSLYFERIVRKKHGRSDEGYYECLARKNGGAMVSRSARLTIAGVERVDSAGSGGAAVEGEMVRVPCNLKAVPPGTLIWQRDKQDLPPDPRYTILDSGVLQIEGVLVSDTGQYRCRITNIAATKYSREEELLIGRPEAPPGRKPPDMLLLPQPVNKKVGDTVTLECAASGLPMPSFSWTFQNDTAVTGPNIDIVGRGNLRIRNLERRHSEMYKCVATSPEDPTQQTIHLTKLTVMEPPRVMTSSPSWEKQFSDTVRIRCEFSGYPSPKITVFKDGKISGPIVTDKPEHMWVITYLDSTHQGYYQCRAENDAGQVSTTMRLKIKPSDDTPERPRNVRARVTGPTSLRVSWDPVPPKNGNSIAGYSVHYRNLAGTLELQAVTFDNTWIDLEQLQPYSNISIYVLAYNKQYASPRSDVIYQLIGEDVPTAGPQVSVEPVGATSLKVSWEKLPIERARGVITEYDIYYKEQDKGSIKVETVMGDIFEHTLSGLDPNKAYDVRVMGKTSQGFPQLTDDEWPWMTVYTNSHHNELEPPNMQVYALNQTAIKVRWWPSDSERRGSAGYQLDVHSIRNVHLKRLLFTPDQMTDTVTNLEPDTMYKISVRCLGTPGQDKQQGEATTRNVKTLKVGERGVLPSSPAPPQELDAYPQNQSAVRLQWYRPKFTPGISFYTIRYKPVQSDFTKAALNDTNIKHVVTNDNETLERLIGGLKPYMLYEFSIRTHTAFSFGTFSNPVKCRTGEGLPLAPRNLQYILRGPGRVELSWEPPQRRNGIITQYLIYYRPDSPDHKWLVMKENGTSLMSEIDNLALGVNFEFHLRARTSVGEGPPSRKIHLLTQNPYPTQATPKGQHWTQEQRKGIIIGVTTIGGIVLIVCVLLIILRKRLCRQPPPAAPARLGSGASPNSTLPLHFNGTYMPNSNGNLSGMAVDAHTMEILTPMLPPLVENEFSDSKGGSGVNGMPGLRVQCMPNGQVATFLANQEPHNDRQQKTSCLMGNGRTGMSVAATVPEGRPDISRDDSSPSGSYLRAGDEDEEDDGSVLSTLTRTSASTTSPTSPAASRPSTTANAGMSPSVSGSNHSDTVYNNGETCIEQQEPSAHHRLQQTAHQQQQQKPAGCAKSRLDSCEDGDGETDAVAEETESSRLLAAQQSHRPNHHRHNSNTDEPPPPQPTQCTHHRSSLTEYASSPPQSRYAEGDTKGLAPADGDTSGTPLLGKSSQLDDSLQYSPKGSSHRQELAELPSA